MPFSVSRHWRCCKIRPEKILLKISLEKNHCKIFLSILPWTAVIIPLDRFSSTFFIARDETKHSRFAKTISRCHGIPSRSKNLISLPSNFVYKFKLVYLFLKTAVVILNTKWSLNIAKFSSSYSCKVISQIWTHITTQKRYKNFIRAAKK